MQIDVVFADIRQRGGLARAMAGAGRVYHLAANPNLWVRDRAEFLAVNYQGTIHVLEAARHQPGVHAVVVVTSDKCYENVGSLWGCATG